MKKISYIFLTVGKLKDALNNNFSTKSNLKATKASVSDEY